MELNTDIRRVNGYC